jgi:hypothetical protein
VRRLISKGGTMLQSRTEVLDRQASGAACLPNRRRCGPYDPNC